MHFKLINIVRNSFILPRADFERVESFKVYAANGRLAQNHGKWEQVWLVEGYEAHADRVRLSVRHVELDDGVWLVSVKRIDARIVPAYAAVLGSFDVDQASDVLAYQVTLCAEDKAHFRVLQVFVQLLNFHLALHLVHL